VDQAGRLQRKQVVIALVFTSKPELQVFQLTLQCTKNFSRIFLGVLVGSTIGQIPDQPHILDRSVNSIVG